MLLKGYAAMRDDFIALDLLSAGGFRWSPNDKRARKKKKALFGLPRRHPQGQATRSLTTLLPKLAAKVKQKHSNRFLQGWPVALSWPNSESTEIH
jgi:hypothetical protein